MTTFLISYDLARPQQNKHTLASAIMMLGQSWARPLEQIWYIRSDADARDIEAILCGLLDDDDGLLVQAVEKDVVMANTTLRWFKQRQAAAVESPINVVAFPVIADKPAIPGDLEVGMPLAEAS